MKKSHEFTEEEVKDIISEKINGVLNKDISKKYNLSSRQLRKIFINNGIKIKSRVYKYNFNEDYFEKIDTEDKAYFLGFITADGTINVGSNAITIIQKETFILYEFKKYINFEGGIIKSNKKSASTITVSSSKTKDDLYKLGVTNNKSKSILFAKIPEHLESHYIRGVFDGDGCISHRIDKRDNSERGQFNICSGSFEFIKEYYNKLKSHCNLSGKNKIQCRRNSYYVIDWGGLSDLEKIYKFLYKDATVFLKRKKGYI